MQNQLLFSKKNSWRDFLFEKNIPHFRYIFKFVRDYPAFKPVYAKPYVVQISIIWDLKNQIRELNEQIVKDKTCKTVKLYYFENEIKFC